ncbi:MAG: phosphorylase [Marinilabiliales bacterium]|nr:MAG: phosphorylase [Marinilabiliales bacterium]
MRKIEPSELIINDDGSIYHIKLKPEDIADDIILVGDPQRVEIVSSFFDTIELKKHNREFNTHTGTYKGKRLTVLSSGIGTDNIDIVVNELDALVNIDLKTRTVKKEHKSLNLIRLGTSGGLQGDIPVDSFLMSKIAIGFDGLLNFYHNRDEVCDLDMEDAFTKYLNWNKRLASPYFVEASEKLMNRLGEGFIPGVTISSPGFYGPQGRILRLPLAVPDMNQKIEDFKYKEYKITNFEMESSAIYGLSKMLGHEALTVCVIIANRVQKTFSADYKTMVKKLIQNTLDKLVAS